MDIILLGIYAFFVWLIFFKFKWLPWNTVSQVIVVIIPIVALTVLILLLNVFAPTSNDVRVVKYYVNMSAQVRGRVEVAPEAAEDVVREAALAEVAETLAGREPKKVIVVKGRLVSVVV